MYHFFIFSFFLSPNTMKSTISGWNQCFLAEIDNESVIVAGIWLFFCWNLHCQMCRSHKLLLCSVLLKLFSGSMFLFKVTLNWHKDWWFQFGIEEFWLHILWVEMANAISGLFWSFFSWNIFSWCINVEIWFGNVWTRKSDLMLIFFF